jgi:hypothetical protein
MGDNLIEIINFYDDYGYIAYNSKMHQISRTPLQINQDSIQFIRRKKNSIRIGLSSPQKIQRLKCGKAP